MHLLISIVNDFALAIGIIASICTIILFVEDRIKKFRQKRRKDGILGKK